MKRKMTALLTVVLMLAMLAGCGNSSQTVTTGGSASDSASGTSKETASSKGGTLSECLSTEKVIAYEVDAVDKSETPDNIYFFENGKVTVIPGEEFGLTMGDFAQMTDKEIWEKSQTVKESYGDSYITQVKKIWQQQIDSLNAKIENDKSQVIWMARNYAEAMPAEMEDIWSKAEEEGTIASDIIDSTYEKVMEVARQQDFYSEFEEFDENMANDLTTIDSLQSLIDKTDLKYPFVDLPFSFIVFTDSTGNNVESEAIVYPVLTLSDSGTVSDNTITYQTLNFALGLTTEQQIYDTTYNCIALSGSGRFCTRETMETDTIDSRNISVDLSKDEINELFREEVMARYE